MYNQVSRGTHFGQGGSHPLPPPPPPPTYQQQAHHPPPPPPHFQQGGPVPGPPGPHVYLRGPPNVSSTGPVNLPFQVPPGVVQSAGQYGNSMAPQMFSTVGQSQHIPPPPPLGRSHLLPPPPPPPPACTQGQILYNLPFIPPPPQPGDLQSHQHSYNTLPPPPPRPGSGFPAPTPDGVYLHSNIGNYQVPSVAPPPPLPPSPPPVKPSPPPPAPPMTSASSNAADSDPNPGMVSVSELKAVDSVENGVASYPYGVALVHNSDPNQDSGRCREVAAADRDGPLSTRNVKLDLPPPPPRPTEEKSVHKIEALCQLIAENGLDIEDKIRREEFQNPEYKFLFGGDPGTEAAISHAYFLWMKKKYNLEHRWHEKKSESQLRPIAVDSTGPQYHLHVSTESADSDMEMEGLFALL